MLGFCSLILLGCASAAVQEPGSTRTVEEIVQEIDARGNKAPAKLFRELAELGTERAFEAHCQAVVELPKGHAGILYVMNSFQAYRAKPGFESRAIGFLADQATQVARYPAAAAGSLALFGEPAHPALMQLLQESNLLSVRRKAFPPLMEELAAIGKPEALALILDNHGGEAVYPLGKTVDGLAKFPLKTLLKNIADTMENDRLPRLVREALVEAVGRFEDADAEDFLRDELGRKLPTWRKRTALRVLQLRGSTGHRKEVAKLTKDPDPVVRFYAIVEEARLRMGDDPLERSILKRARSRDELDRQAAAAALLYANRDVAVGAIQELIADPARPVRSTAIATALVLRCIPLIEPLIERLDVETAATRAQLHQTLMALTGKSMPASAAMWRAWWQDEQREFELPTREEAELALAAMEKERAEATSDRTVAAFFNLPIVSDRVVFVVDSSASMVAKHKVQGGYEEGKLGTRMEVAKWQLKNALDGMPDGTLFNIVFFDHGFEAWRETMVRLDESSRAEAKAYIEERAMRQDTAVFDALEWVLTDYNLDVDTIYLLSDGMPYRGKMDEPERIRAWVREWNEIRRITIHSISIGGRIGLLKDLAADSGGEFRQLK